MRIEFIVDGLVGISEEYMLYKDIYIQNYIQNMIDW